MLRPILQPAAFRAGRMDEIHDAQVASLVESLGKLKFAPEWSSVQGFRDFPHRCKRAAVHHL